MYFVHLDNSYRKDNLGTSISKIETSRLIASCTDSMCLDWNRVWLNGQVKKNHTVPCTFSYGIVIEFEICKIILCRNTLYLSKLCCANKCRLRKTILLPYFPILNYANRFKFEFKSLSKHGKLLQHRNIILLGNVFLATTFYIHSSYFHCNI